MPPAEPPTLSDKELDDMETLELEEEEELDASFGLNTGLYPPRPRGSCARVRPLGIPGAGGAPPGHGGGRRVLGHGVGSQDVAQGLPTPNPLHGGGMWGQPMGPPPILTAPLSPLSPVGTRSPVP